MTRRQWLLAIVVAGLAVLALSFVPQWLAQQREVRGEGYRMVLVSVSAWTGAGVPVLSAGVAIAALVGVAAIIRERLPRGLLVLGSALALGLMLAGAWPISQDGHASSVDVGPGWALVIGVVLAAAMLLASLRLVRPSRGVLVAAAVIGVVAVAGGAAGRWWVLQTSEGTNQRWEEGSYTRSATGGQPTETLTIRDGRFTIGDRWSGTWESSGGTVSLDNGSACPDSRGTYHAHRAGDDDLRFVKLVDTCGDGERAADLETGIWERVP